MLPMKLVVTVLTALLLSAAASAQTGFDFRVSDLSVSDYRAIEAAIPELARQGLKPEQYNRVRVIQFDASEISVGFYQRDNIEYDATGKVIAVRMGNSAHRGEASDIEITMSAKDLKILRFNYVR